MNDKNNELQPADSNSSQTLSRAERIMAIKNSIRSDKPSIDSKSVADKTEKSVQSNNSVDNDWESEISERIARRVQAMKNNRENTSNEEDECEVPENADDRKFVPSENDSVVAEETSDAVVSTDTPEKVNPQINKRKKKKKKNLGQSLLGLLPQKKDKMSERIRKSVFLISCAAIVVCGYMVISYYTDTISTQNDYDEIEKVYIDYNELMSVPQEEKEEEVVYPMFSWAETMLKQNKDLVGYITIPGSINDPEADNELAYPVVRSDDLEKYLNISFTGEEARAGTLFMDYRNRFDDLKDGKIVEENSDNLIIYGHNMQTGDMFGKLKNYRNNSNYYGEHPVINLDSKYFHYQYKIFAFFIVDAEDDTDTAFDCWNYINFENEKDFYDYVNEAKKRTLRLNDVDVKYGDKLLTLSTCNSIFGNDGPGRLIVMARQVRENEDPYEGTQNSSKNPNIKWPSLYYKYNKNEKYDPDAEFIPYGEDAESVTTNTKE